MARFAFDAIGWIAAGLAIFAFQSKTMVPLRLAATLATAFGFVFAASRLTYPSMALNAALFVLNVQRLAQMRRLIRDAHRATERPAGYEWLKPFMHPVDFPGGHTLFRRGDLADEAFLLGDGEVFVPEHGAVAAPGDLIGEMGLLTQEKRRTASALCRTPVRAWRISYKELERLCLDNPDFCLSLARIVMRRYEANLIATCVPGSENL